ncbi:MAG: hypothetical protein EXS10_10365 [Phycisphaerales bacterium]|nr:hypothetical protein [Phycisphaerales bacterium]
MPCSLHAISCTLASAVTVLTTSVLAQSEPILRVWSAKLGGNGHAYESFELSSPHTFAQAQLFATRRGGRLVLPNSPSEESFVLTLLADSVMTSSWIDGWRDPDWAPGLLDAKSVPADWIRASGVDHTLDIVLIGDSNIMFRTTGWDHGLQHALASHNMLCAAIGPTPFNHDGGSVGWRWSKFIGVDGAWPLLFGNGATSTLNAPAELAQHHDFPNGFPNTGAGYAWLSNGSAEVFGGFGIGATHPFVTEHAALQFRVRYGYFPSGGSFCPTAWRNYSSERVTGDRVLCDAHTSGVGEASLQVSGALGEGNGFRFALDDGAGINAPVFFSWASVERTDVTHGWSASVLNWHSGGSTRDIANDIDGFGDATSADWVALLRARQSRRGQSPRVLFVLSTGMNDGSLTASEHETELQRMLTRLDQIWIEGGGNSNETAYLIKTSHDSQMEGSTLAFKNFRERARVIASERSDTASVDLGKVTMRPLYFPQDNGGSAHLSTLGYENLSTYIIDAAFGAMGGACDWQWGEGGVPTEMPWGAGYEDLCITTCAVMHLSTKGGSTWTAEPPSSQRRSVIVEYSSDCDADGVIDRIAVDIGLVVDLNGDAIPDRCQCLADLNRDATVDSADLVMLLGDWDLDTAADFDGSNRVDAADLVYLIDRWGACAPRGGG